MDGHQLGVAAIDAVSVNRIAPAEIVAAGQALGTLAAAHARRKQHAPARFHALAQLTHRHHFAGDIGAQHVRHGELQPRNSGAHEKIQVIERAGAHAQQNLVGFDRRLGSVFVYQRVRPAVLVNASDFHRYDYNGLSFPPFPVTSEVSKEIAIVKFCVLSSGSSGNAAFLATDTTRLLIDAGLSLRDLARRLASIGERPETIDAILITHEHCDHISGLVRMARRLGVRVYLTRLTAPLIDWENAWKDTPPRIELFQAGASFSIGDIAIDSFTIPTTPPIPWAIACAPMASRSAW